MACQSSYFDQVLLLGVIIVLAALLIFATVAILRVRYEAFRR